MRGVAFAIAERGHVQCSGERHHAGLGRVWRVGPRVGGHSTSKVLGVGVVVCALRTAASMRSRSDVSVLGTSRD